MNQTNFQDVFKKNFLEIVNYGQISYVNVLTTLIVTLVIAIFIIQIYKRTFEGVMYQPAFAKSILISALVTSVIIMTISSNVVLSLGMVGALSIVRYRAAVKDPKDIAFVFWAIATGISTGAMLYMIAAISSLFIGVVLLIVHLKKTVIRRYILVIRHTEEGAEEVHKIIGHLSHELKSKVVSKGEVELTLELDRVGKNTAFVNELSQLPGVKSAMLVHYTGDYLE